MKQCAICGHAAQRGSICYDCRAAIKRARDATVSQFQGLPALAVVTCAGSAPVREMGRAPFARVARPARTPRKATEAAGAATVTALVEVPGTRRGGGFVWVIVTLMVLVVTYVAYGVITAAIDSSSSQQAQFAKPDAPAADPVVPVPRVAGADAAVLTAHEPDLAAAPVLKDHQSSVPPAQSHDPHGTAPSPRVAPRAKDSLPRPNAPDNAASRPAQPAVSAPAAAEPAVVNAAPSPPVRTARTSDAPRVDRWERMAAAIQACAGKDFLGGVVCEQRTRIDYCEGWWGRVPQCPAGIPNDHGQ